MTQRRPIDRQAVELALRQNERVLTHAELRYLGIPSSTITFRIGPRGNWQRIHPGVVLAHRGTPTRRERGKAALKFAGDGAVITGLAALSRYGVRAAQAGVGEHVLVPAPCQRKSRPGLIIERTGRQPKTTVVQGVECAEVSRAVVDACRHLENLDRVREVTAEVVQARLCSLAEIAREVRDGARRGTALTREVLREMDAGIRSVAEAHARELFAVRGVRQPLWNVQVLTADGEVIATPDGFWEDVAAAVEIDSMLWHQRPERYRWTQRRQRRMTRHGIFVLPVAPADVLHDGDNFCAEVIDLLHQASLRVPPPLTWRRLG